MAQIELTVKDDRTTMDQLLWRRLRREVPGLTEETYDRNPGLAAKGAYLPLGTVVIVRVPDPTPVARTTRPIISLWTEAS